jgi:CRP-like cAMP-binding protein
VSGSELSHFAPLAELWESELALIEELLEPLGFDAGEQMFRKGQESDGLWLIQEGSVRIVDAQGRHAGSLGPGDAMGGLSLVVVGPRACGAVAVGPVTVLRLSRTAFHRLSEDAPRASARILSWLVRDLAAPLRAGLEELVDGLGIG